MSNSLNNSKISIITVVYNAEQYIENTMQSVLNQDYSHIEYIIIDGSSTDNTMGIINLYRNKISIILSEPDKGIYDAMNKGIKLASGEVINLLNAGDLYSDNHCVTKVMNTFNQTPNTSCVYGKARVLHEDGTPLIRRGKPVILGDKRIGFMKLSHQSLFYKKDLHELVGYYDLKFKLVADRHFMAKAHFNKDIEFVYIDKILIVSLHGGASNERKLRLKEDLILYNEIHGHKVNHYVDYMLKYIYTIWLNFRNNT